MIVKGFDFHHFAMRRADTGGREAENLQEDRRLDAIVSVLVAIRVKSVHR